MKVKATYWKDTGNLDLMLEAESEIETAMLGLLRDREPHWSGGTSGDIRKQELIFPPPHEVTKKKL